MWRAIPGHEGLHEISSLGRVRILDRIDRSGAHRRGKVLNARAINGAHLMVTLYKDGARRDALVHRLVLEAFVGPCPSGQEACHANDDPRDNRLENLRWDTRSANALDSVRNGTHHAARRTHCAQGHEFTASNTYRYPSGKRSCVVCRRASNSRRKAA